MARSSRLATTDSSNGPVPMVDPALITVGVWGVIGVPSTLVPLADPRSITTHPFAAGSRRA